MFKGHYFPKVVILQAVYYKLRFSLSYRDIEELLLCCNSKYLHTFFVFIITKDIAITLENKISFVTGQL